MQIVIFEAIIVAQQCNVSPPWPGHTYSSYQGQLTDSDSFPRTTYVDAENIAQSNQKKITFFLQRTTSPWLHAPAPVLFTCKFKLVCLVLLIISSTRQKHYNIILVTTIRIRLALGPDRIWSLSFEYKHRDLCAQEFIGLNSIRRFPRM